MLYLRIDFSVKFSHELDLQIILAKNSSSAALKGVRKVKDLAPLC